MAKVSFSKLGITKSKFNEIKTFKFNDQEIEVKQYLPVNHKLEMITKVADKTLDEIKFFNPVKIDVYLALEIVYNYTNINFTEKQKEDEANLYDLIKISGLLNEIVNNIPNEEYEELVLNTSKCIQAISDYYHSIMGILNNIGSEKEMLEFNIEDIINQLNDPEALTTLKDIAPLLGNGGANE